MQTIHKLRRGEKLREMRLLCKNGSKPGILRRAIIISRAGGGAGRGGKGAEEESFHVDMTTTRETRTRIFFFTLITQL